MLATMTLQMLRIEHRTHRVLILTLLAFAGLC